MKGLTTWLHHPFMPIDRRKEADLPYVCRISVDESAFTCQWADNGDGGPHTLLYRKAGSSQPETVLPLVSDTVTVTGLEDKADYEFSICRADGSRSAVRQVHTGKIPGDAVVNYLHPADFAYRFSGHFLGSPTLARCPSGRLVAAMDVFWRKEYHAMLSILCCSDDNGVSWRWLGELAPCYWPKLFTHRGRAVLHGGLSGRRQPDDRPLR